MSAFNRLIKLKMFIIFLLALVSCDEVKGKPESETDGSATGGAKLVKCTELEATGTLDPESLQDAFALPDGRRAVVAHRRTLTEGEAALAVPITLKNRSACIQIYEALHRQNEPGYESANPLSQTKVGGSFTRVVNVDGSDVHVVPTTYHGLEIQTSVYEEVDVQCRTKRLGTRTVKRLRKSLVPLIGQCAFPASYKAEIPHLGVHKIASVPNLDNRCLKVNVFKPDRCAEEHFSIGGVYRASNDDGVSPTSAEVMLAWSIRRPDVATIENLLRAAIGLRKADPLALSVAAEGIAADDAFPIRAIGFADNGQLAGIRYWGLTYPHSPSNVDPSSVSRPVLPQEDPKVDVLGEGASDEQTITVLQALANVIGTSSDLSAWDRQMNAPPSSALAQIQSQLVGLQFRDAIKNSLEARKPLTVFLVWSPTDNSRAVLTKVTVLPEGKLGEIRSSFINQLSDLGLPENLLRL